MPATTTSTAVGSAHFTMSESVKNGGTTRTGMTGKTVWNFFLFLFFFLLKTICLPVVDMLSEMNSADWHARMTSSVF